MSVPLKRLYEVVSGHHGRFIDGAPVEFGPGDKMELTDAEATAMAERVRPLFDGVEVTVEDVPPVDPGATTGADLEEFLARPWATVRRDIGAIEDAQALRELIDAEVVGRKRKAIIAAAEERISELEADEEDQE